MKLNTFFPSAVALVFATLIGGSMLTGCADSSNSEDVEQQSRVYISMTDAEGDFTQYTVDVTALKLYHANGAIIETLPNTTRLDFAQYVDVTEFLTTATVPVGAYSKAEITLDYSNAELTVENQDGLSIPAQAVDDEGNPLQSVTLSTLINSTEGFIIRFGRPASLSIDFNLEASNLVEIDDGGASATVTVNPVLVANTSIDDEKIRRARGLLSAVMLDDASFEIDIRPFRIRHHSYGSLTVTTDDATLYEIDGEVYTPETGLAAMAELEMGSPVVVLGQFSFTDHVYLATQVYAGSSVPWDNKDVVRGSVIARADNTLTVLGATIELDDGHFQFNDEVSVQIDDMTRVHRQGSTDPATITDISIGQRVVILGDMTDDNSMDAGGEGIVRMRYSDISGTVSSVSPLQLNLQHMNRRSVSRYDFSGSGIDSDNDADPQQYEVDTGLLPLDSLQADSPVKVRGFPTAFGSAPEDFSAKSIADVSQVMTKMQMYYGRTGSPTAVVSLDESSLLLDVESTTRRHHLKQAGIITDITELSSVPLITADDGHALYAINQGKSLRVFTEWGQFQQSLASLLEDNHQVILVINHGQYDHSELTISARHLIIRLTE